jgi:hypothetical protein
MDVVTENQLNASLICNTDETGLSALQRKTRKILAIKGEQQTGK